eukprot:GABV01012829.1.p1 GENE.GABV01012829.1~~GABV01012829.1.p1  ORF type:complete len:124 (-),score=26.33 GABV01012829.1:3-374(-)
MGTQSTKWTSDIKSRAFSLWPASVTALVGRLGTESLKSLRTQRITHLERLIALYHHNATRPDFTFTQSHWRFSCWFSLTHTLVTTLWQSFLDISALVELLDAHLPFELPTDICHEISTFTLDA